MLIELFYMPWADQHPALFFVLLMWGMGLIICLVTMVAERWIK